MNKMLKLFVLRGPQVWNSGFTRSLYTSSKFPQKIFISTLISKSSFLGYLAKLVQFKLADIGEGIAEVEMKEW